MIPNDYWTDHFGFQTIGCFQTIAVAEYIYK